jgi:hypothetical protein
MRVTFIALAVSFVAAVNATAAPRVVNVSDVENLYKAVNSAVNAGATIVLAPNHYVLTKLCPDGSMRPNGGRLELQANMSMSGVAGHPEDVVIDSSDPDKSPDFMLPNNLGNAGTIRIGRGVNAVEWLTVIGRAASAAGVQTDLGGGAAVLRIEHINSRNSVRGIDVRNLGPDGAGRSLLVDVGDNELFDNTASNGQGIRVLNSNADGASIVATLHGNRSHDNNSGFLVSNLGSSHASIVVQSLDDSFEDNLVGGVIYGGLVMNAGTVANDNAVSVTMVGGTISGSHGTLPPQGFTAGLNIVGGSYTNPESSLSTSRNAVQVTLSDVVFANNAAFDVAAWGAKAPADLLAGTNNTVAVALLGASSTASVAPPIASAPTEPAGTNRVAIAR